jgi:hypothetical protein
MTEAGLNLVQVRHRQHERPQSGALVSWVVTIRCCYREALTRTQRRDGDTKPKDEHRIVRSIVQRLLRWRFDSPSGRHVIHDNATTEAARAALKTELSHNLHHDEAVA